MQQDPQINQKLKWKALNTRHIVQNQWIDFRETEFQFPDGTSFKPYYSYTRRDYVVVIAITETGEFICVRQYRQGIDKVTTEFPAGGLEYSSSQQYNTDGNDQQREDALKAAQRELLEETGYTSQQWHHLITLPSNATISSNYGHIFIARNCVKTQEQSLDPTEYLQLEFHDSQEIDRLIREGNFEQSMHVLGYYLAKSQNLL